MNCKAHFSKASDEWGTPPELFNKLRGEFPFTLDVCATPQNAKCDRFFTMEHDGLAMSWAGEVCWMNPPYSKLKEWLAKAWKEARCLCATVVALVPSRTDTRAWHEYVWNEKLNKPREGVEVRFLRGRLKFTRDGAVPPYPAPFPSAIVIFRP